jgi:hypothetical protein
MDFFFIKEPAELLKKKMFGIVTGKCHFCNKAPYDVVFAMLTDG